MRYILICFILVIGCNRNFSNTSKIEHSKKCPNECKSCSVAIEKGIDYIVRQQQSSGQMKAQEHAAAIHTALSGLVFLSQGSTLVNGKYHKNLTKCKLYLDKWDQNDKKTYAAWSLIYVALFYTQLQTISPSNESKKRLDELITRLIAIKHPKGGWAHTYNPNKPAEYPYSFPTATIIGLWVLYQSKQLGIEINDDIFNTALDHIKNATNEEGCIEHGPGIGEQSINVAKTASGLGIARLINRRQDSEWIKKMTEYVAKHMSTYKGVKDEHSQVEIINPFAAITLEQMGKRTWLDNLRQTLVTQQDQEGAWKIPGRRRGGAWFEGKLMVSAGNVILLLSHNSKLVFDK